MRTAEIWFFGVTYIEETVNTAQQEMLKFRNIHIEIIFFFSQGTTEGYTRN